MDWANYILAAQRAGFTVTEDELGWWITTPKMPRRPSETLGVWRDAQAAWRGAALICSQLWPTSPTREGETVD